MTTATEHSVRHERAAGLDYVARCACGWESAPCVSTDGLPLRCRVESDAETRRNYAVVRTPLGAERTYLLRERSGTAELVAARGVGGTPARHECAGGPLRLVLEDGRSFLVVLRTCDACGDAFEGPGARDGSGHVFCDADCRADYQWRR